MIENGKQSRQWIEQEEVEASGKDYDVDMEGKGKSCEAKAQFSFHNVSLSSQVEHFHDIEHPSLHAGHWI